MKAISYAQNTVVKLTTLYMCSKAEPFGGNKFHTYICLARNPNPESKGVSI